MVGSSAGCVFQYGCGGRLSGGHCGAGRQRKAHEGKRSGSSVRVARMVLPPLRRMSGVEQRKRCQASSATAVQNCTPPRGPCGNFILPALYSRQGGALLVFRPWCYFAAVLLFGIPTGFWSRLSSTAGFPQREVSRLSMPGELKNWVRRFDTNRPYRVTFRHFCRMAKLVRLLTLDQVTLGSNPSPATI